MNILITGGAGFIGSTLADRLLKDGHIVTVVDNFNDYYSKELKIKNIQHNLSNEKYILYEEDIRNKAAIKNSRIICSPRREKRIPETPQSRINTMFLRLCSFLWLRYKNLF